jgi:cobalamin biosynthetic protein CobC
MLANEPATPVKDHGGALARAEARFGRPAAGWLDLSTGINPWPYPVPALSPAAWTRLPDRDTLQALLDAAAQAYGIADPTAIVAAPGSQALIQTIPRLHRPGTVAILGFTYAEHARCWAMAGHEVAVAADLDTAARADCVVVTNPNNPDGRQVAPELLLDLVGRLAERRGLLLVDEAFADVTPTLSVAGAAGREGLCVLRSFGKFYGLAGLRLGFALGAPSLVQRIEAELGPWAVAGPALAVGRTALLDSDWAATMRARLTTAAAALDRLLTAHGLDPVGGTDLFRLVRTDRSSALYEQLGRCGILVRVFAEKADWLRFGLLPDAAATDRLSRVLAEAGKKVL